MADIYRVLFGREEIYNLRDRYVPTHRSMEALIYLLGTDDTEFGVIKNLLNSIIFKTPITFFLILPNPNFLGLNEVLDYRVTGSIIPISNADLDIEENINYNETQSLILESNVILSINEVEVVS